MDRLIQTSNRFFPIAGKLRFRLLSSIQPSSLKHGSTRFFPPAWINQIFPPAWINQILLLQLRSTSFTPSYRHRFAAELNNPSGVKMVTGSSLLDYSMQTDVHESIKHESGVITHMNESIRQTGIITRINQSNGQT